jgi:hypothetical protein
MSIRPSPSSELSRRFPGLLTLVTEFVNLSWDFEYPDPEAAVLAFLAAFPEEASSAASGVAALLSECPDEQTRHGELSHLGWGYATRQGKLDEFLLWTLKTLHAGTDAVVSRNAGPAV